METPNETAGLPARGQLPVFAAGFAVAAGCLVLAGWQFDIVALKSLTSSLVPMNPLTAVGFILSGLALLLFLKDNRRSQTAGRLVSCAVVTLGLLKLLSFFGLDTGIDRILYPQKIDLSPLNIPNRMAPNTALGFLTTGIALLFLRTRFRLSQAFSLLTLAISLIPIIGYLYGVTPLTQISYFIPMALNSAITFLVLTAGILAGDTRQGIMEQALSDDTGGILIRRMLPAMFLILLVTGGLSIGGQDLGLFGSRYAAALMTVSSIVAFTAVIFFSARKISAASNELKELNARLERNVHELSFVNKELESFSYSVSHDLRAPLRSITGFAQILEESDGGKLSAEGRDALVRVIHAADRMGLLIDGLLEMSRINRKEFIRQPVSLSKLASRVVDDLRRITPWRPVTIDITPDLSAEGDERLLSVVLQNLIGNAWKYSSKKPSATITFGRTERNGKNVFFVKDNGAGFDMAYAGKLFGAFQRLHNMNEFEGTGIGLATVQRIIHRHGGEIWAEAKPDEGATFYFRL